MLCGGAVHILDSGEHGVAVELLAGPDARGGAPCAGVDWMVQDGTHEFGEGAVVTGREVSTGDSVFEQLGGAAGRGGEHRDSTGHGFEDGVTEGFVFGAGDEGRELFH